MLNEILEFFKREKKYAWLFAVLCLVYGGLITARGMNPPPEENHQILEEFKKAENKVQAKVKTLGSIEAYLKDRPDLVLWVNLFSLLFILALGTGIVLDFLLFTRPAFRARFQIERSPPAIAGRLSLLFKFFIWFFTANLGVSLILGLSQKIVPVTENLFILLHTAAAELISFAVIFWILKSHGSCLAEAGFNLPEKSWIKEIKIGWGGYLAVLPIFGLVLLALLLITNLLNYEPPPHPLVPIFLEEETRGRGIVIYSLFLAAIAGPVFEEIFFRGFCYPILKGRFGTLSAMVITSSFFAFIHDSTFAFWPIFILGMALNLIYEKRGSLASTITLHITHNILFLSYFFLAKDIISRELGG